MRFISPKTDFAFKKIFASEDSKDILISFLNALLYEGEPIIEDLEIIDPYSASKITGLKDSYLDVKARLNDGTAVIIEMQVLNVEAFDKRVLCNAAKTYAIQLKTGEGYSKLKPVIALTITDFKMFDKWDEVTSRFVFKEKKKLVDYPDNHLEMVFVELPKFGKELNDLESLTDKWIYFMKTASNLEIIPETMGTVPEIQKAFKIANEANLTMAEWEELEKQAMFLEDRRGAIIKGREEGRQEGQLALISRQLARRFGELSPEIKSRLQNLSSEKLESLAEAMLDLTNVSELINWLSERSK